MNESKTLVKDMTSGPVVKELILFALPIMLANILQAVYNMVDMIVVGQFVGASGLSAVGIGGQLTNMFLCIGMGFSYGGQVLVSQQIGMKNKDLQSTIGTLFTTELILGLATMVLGIAFATPLLNLLNTPAEAWDDAMDYLIICCVGMVFIFGYNAVCSILRGMGQSKLPMLFILIASIINLVLDLVFVAVFGMSADGAALATVIAQAVAFISSAIYLYRHRESFGFDFKLSSFKLDMSRLKPMAKLGIPYIAQSLMITCSMMYVNASVNNYGVAASAADGIGSKLNSVANICTGAVSAASSTMMAQCFGAREIGRMKKCMWACTGICMASWAVLSIVYLLFPEWVFGLFSTDPEVIAIAPMYLKIAVVWVLSMASMNGPYAICEGVGNAGYGLIVSIADGVVGRIGLCILLGHFWGLAGYWMGTALAGFITTIMMGAYYFSGRWQHRKLLLD